MKQHRNWMVVAVMALALCESVLAKGAGGGKAPKAAATPASNAPVVWLVDSVDSNCCALAKTDFSERKNLIIGATTEIFVKGQLGKLSDIQVGMVATFVATDTEVTRLSLDTYVPPTPAPAAKAQKAPKAAKAPAVKAPKAAKHK